MLRHRLTRVLLAVVALAAVAAPVLAAGAPACCAKPAAVKAASHGCCPAPAAAAAMPKGCCKAPEAPRPETKTSAGSVLAAIATAVSADAPVLDVSVLPALVVSRVARHEHRAVSPDDSPPDRLSRNRILLI